MAKTIEVISNEAFEARKAQQESMAEIEARIEGKLPEDEAAEPAPVYEMAFDRRQIDVLGNALSLALAASWVFSPDETMDDDIRHAHQVRELLKAVNARLPLELRQGCVSGEFLPEGFGDIYIDGMYRIDTKLMGPAIAVARFKQSPEIVSFRLFDPVSYPNARSITACLGDEVPLADISRVEEVSALTKTEKSQFAQAIKEAWADWY
ncbi:MAG: hypothetical protein HUK26_07135 [Duodenibacillus sp.]|nr:hypothetical protein [Duodenibacillus sp.]